MVFTLTMSIIITSVFLPFLFLGHGSLDPTFYQHGIKTSNGGLLSQ